MEELFLKLDAKEKEIIEVGKHLYKAYKYAYHFDLYCIAQLNRSINLINGFSLLGRSDNFIAAFPLVRLHLDTLQRIFAFQLIDKNIDEIVKEILGGKKISDYKSKISGKKLSDSELSKSLSEVAGFDWVKFIYLAGNNFVHFSDKHILASTISDIKEGKYKSTISRGSIYITKEEKEGSCYQMERITDAILFFINEWIEQKRTYI